MNKPYSSVMIILFTILLITGCKKVGGPVASENARTVIVPLVVGNQWQFVDSTFSYSGTVQQVDTTILGITGSMTIQYQSKNYLSYYWNWFDQSNKLPSDRYLLCSNESDGLNFYGGVTSKGVYILVKNVNPKYPVNVGDIWEDISFIINQDNTIGIYDTTQLQCIATENIINTPAGSFKCCVSQRTAKSYPFSIEEYYYAPGIGMIGMTSKTNNKVTFRKVLISYHLN
jgi:hypothetical protein